MAPGKKDARAAFHKKMILEAANRLFLQKGLEGATMDDIAREAEYSKSTIYVYFKSKEEILLHIVCNAMTRFEAEIRELFARKLGMENFFLGLCHILAGLHSDSPVYFAALMGKIMQSPEDLKEDLMQEVYQTGERINDIIGARIEQGMAEGDLRPGLPLVETVFTLWTALSGLIEYTRLKENYLLHRLGKGSEEILEAGYALIYQGIATNSAIYAREGGQ